MDQLTNRRPSFLDIVNKQRIAHHRLNKDKTTRSEAEIGHYRRTLQPVPLGDLELPHLPLVRSIDATDTHRYVVLCEIAQQPGKVVLLDIESGAIDVEHTVDQLQLLSPADL